MNILLICPLLILLFSFCQANNLPWSIKDRFSGIRFELHLKKSHSTTTLDHCKNTIKQTIQLKANEYACFGWVQDSTKGNTIVGEARCNKQMGYQMKRFLHGDDDFQHQKMTSRNNKKIEGKMDVYRDCVDATSIKDYEDTKIKLHFSHFKILDSRRETCFRDEPHKCSHNLDLI